LLYFHFLINLANEKNSCHHLEHCSLNMDYCLRMLIETADFLYQLIPTIEHNFDQKLVQLDEFG
jgi:hypothetical protein